MNDNDRMLDNHGIGRTYGLTPWATERAEYDRNLDNHGTGVRSDTRAWTIEKSEYDRMLDGHGIGAVVTGSTPWATERSAYDVMLDNHGTGAVTYNPTGTNDKELRELVDNFITASWVDLSVLDRFPDKSISYLLVRRFKNFDHKLGITAGGDDLKRIQQMATTDFRIMLKSITTRNFLYNPQAGVFEPFLEPKDVFELLGKYRRTLAKYGDDFPLLDPETGEVVMNPQTQTPFMISEAFDYLEQKAQDRAKQLAETQGLGQTEGVSRNGR